MNISPTGQFVTPSSIVSGIWKFSPEITSDSLVKVAQKWARRGPETGVGMYLRLFVRGIGTDAYGIGFEYLFSSNTHKRYFYRTAAELTEQFGDEFVGYDISSPTSYIDVKLPIVIDRYDEGFRAMYGGFPSGGVGIGNSEDTAILALIAASDPSIPFVHGFKIHRNLK